MAALSAAAVGATYSRAAWIGVVAGVATLGAGLRRRAAVALLGICLAAGIVCATIPSIRARTLSAVKTTANPDRSSTTSEAVHFNPELHPTGGGP